MKVLIPYDGTKNAENALLDLQNAGFGQDDEILIVITDIWLPGTVEEHFKAKNERRLSLERSGFYSHSPARQRIEEEHFLTSRIQFRLAADFKAQNFQIQTLPGLSLVSSEVLEKVASWKAELIILGLQNEEIDAANDGYRSGLWRVLAEAECSVRLAFGTNRETSTINPKLPGRIIAVLNGSETDAKVVDAVIRRRWPAGSEIRLIKLNQSLFPEKEKTSSRQIKIGTFKTTEPIYKNATPPQRGNITLNSEVKLLEAEGLRVSTTILKENASSFVISREISDWKPDCVFIADTKVVRGKQTPEQQAVSNDIAGMLSRQARYSIEIVRSTEKVEHVRKTAMPRRREPQREIKHSASAAVSF